LALRKKAQYVVVPVDNKIIHYTNNVMKNMATTWRLTKLKGPWFSVQVLLMFSCEWKDKSVYFCCAFCAFLLYGFFFWMIINNFKKEKKKTYLLIIRQNTLRRIKIQFCVIS
jgi:hypothetical protein